MLKRRLSAAILGLALSSAAAADAAASPKVVATIAPVHSITAMVMRGIAEPVLLVRPGASPHEFALRPSDAQALDDADVVIWVGEQLETFLTRPLAALAADATVLTLAEVPGVHVVQARSDENWSHEHHHDHDHGAAGPAHDSHGHHHHEGGIDPHLWLDPANAKAWVNAIAETLAAADTGNATAYRKNATDALHRIEATESEVRDILAPVRTKPYVVFHDAYHYFEDRFGMNAVGSVSLSDAQEPGAAHVRDLREKMRGQGVACIFTEPQFEPRLVSVLIEGTAIGVGELDPLGAALKPGPNLYPSLLLDLAHSLRDCLAS